MKTWITRSLMALALLLTLNFQLSTGFAQGTTAFAYQGQLRDGGTNANGTYVMIFKLYDSLTSGSQIGGAITSSPALFNGLFTVNLDFGAGAFNGAARWLDITVTNGPDTQTLSPRVQVLPAPYAQFATTAATVTNAAIKNAQLAFNAVNATNIAGGQIVKSLNGLTDAVSLSAGTNVTLTTNGNTLSISASGGGGGVAVTNTLAAGNNVGLFTNSGIVQVSSFVPNIQLFNNVTNATFSVPTNVTRIMVEMWGAGGGGGAGNNTGGTIGGGGGAGSYAWNVFTVTAGTSYQVTAGSGGAGGIAGGANGAAGPASSFGVLMTAGGGGGGSNATVGGNGNGGAGGNSTGSIHNVQGDSGDNNGNGGGVWRGGAGAQQSGNGSNGPGGGGSGGGPGPPSSPGNDGNSGVVLVYY